MTDRDVTFVIIPENTSHVKQFKFSRTFIIFAACFIALGITAVSVIVYDYCKLKRALPSMRTLEREATGQRTQIQAFAKKINTLRSDIVALQEFERKIRVIANVERPADQDAVFGIGGSMPEDLDASLPLTEKHNRLLRQMHAQAEHLHDASAIQKVAFEELHKYLQSQKSLLASTPAIRPSIGWVSSGFGYRISPFTGLKEFHQGIDIATRMGTPVIAPADGTVAFIGTKGGLGKAMVVDHGYGMATRYGHLKKYLVKQGTRVKRGDKIALVGNSGRSTAPHLHYEVHLNGIPVNPSKYILN
ncbi:MAG: M23 family metallopeptidase [Desulfobacterales bacterium]|nr:M23 family metallopeptidase [Desulfobacterales bacterium]